MHYVQPAAARFQRRLQLADGFKDEHDPAIAARQRIQDFRIEDESAMHGVVCRECRMERSMIEVAQVAAEPDET